MRKKSLLILLATLVQTLLSSCSKQNEITTYDSVGICIRASKVQTKTQISGLSLSWNDGDAIGLYAEGIQDNVLLSYTEDDKFEGKIPASGRKEDNIAYYAYYPYNDSFSGSVINGALSSSQSAPFDSRYDYIVAGVEEGPYNEDEMPELQFSFENHLFGLVKLTITNTNEKLQDEVLTSVNVQAPNGLLSGDFTVDIKKGDFARPEFIGNVYDDVTLAYPSDKCPRLGLNERHEIYAIVMSSACRGLNVTVNTRNYKGLITASNVITFLNGYVTELPPINFGEIAEEKPHEFQYDCAFMGDSITDNWDNAHPNFFSNNKYLNKGIGGNTTAQMLKRFQKDILDNDPKAVIILGGVNDYYHGVGNDSLTVDNIKKMATMASEYGCKVLLCSIMLTHTWDLVQPDGRTRKENMIKMNNWIKTYADEKGYPYVDYYHLLTDKDGNYVGSYFSDGVHPTPATYEIMEAYVKPKIDAVLAKQH